MSKNRKHIKHFFILPQIISHPPQDMSVPHTHFSTPVSDTMIPIDQHFEMLMCRNVGVQQILERSV